MQTSDYLDVTGNFYAPVAKAATKILIRRLNILCMRNSHMFNAPLSSQRADALINALDVTSGDQIVDIGCGDGQFLHRIATHQPIIGTGVDNNAELIEQANTRAQALANGSQLTFVVSDGATYLTDREPVNVIVCIGAEFVFGGYRQLLDAANAHLKANGKLLVGTVYWKQPPSDEYLTLMNGENPHFDLHTTVQIAYEQGYSPLTVHRSSDDEWDAFESFHARKRYTSATQSDQPALRERAWRWQSGYLRWGMSTMGFCFLVLQRL